MTTILIILLLIVDVVLLGVLYFIGKRRINPVEVISELNEERRLLKEMRENIREEMEIALNKSMAHVDKMHTVATEVEMEVRTGSETLKSELETLIKEMAIRVALGADGRDVVRSVAMDGVRLAACGLAAGVVIAPGPIDDYVPVSIQKGGNGGDDDAMVVTQYDMNALEDAGMLKMDFLGLKTLTVIHDAVEMVKTRYGKLANPDTGEEYEIVDDIPLDDPAVYKMMARGGTSGIFQFESNLANDKLRSMRCDRFEDLVATNAHIRLDPARP